MRRPRLPGGAGPAALRFLIHEDTYLGQTAPTVHTFNLQRSQTIFASSAGGRGQLLAPQQRTVIAKKGQPIPTAPAAVRTDARSTTQQAHGFRGKSPLGGTRARRRRGHHRLFPDGGGREVVGAGGGLDFAAPPAAICRERGRRHRLPAPPNGGTGGPKRNPTSQTPLQRVGLLAGMRGRGGQGRGVRGGGERLPVAGGWLAQGAVSGGVPPAPRVAVRRAGCVACSEGGGRPRPAPFVPPTSALGRQLAALRLEVVLALVVRLRSGLSSFPIAGRRPPIHRRRPHRRRCTPLGTPPLTSSHCRLPFPPTPPGHPPPPPCRLPPTSRRAHHA